MIKFNLIAPQSAINYMGSTMSLPNTNCPGVAFNVAITTATAIEIVMILITTFSFSVIRLVWMFASHLGNDLLLLIRLPLLAVNIELIL
jgi:hypothetical protein